MKKNIAVIEGDGIGPEVTRQSVRVLNAIAQAFGHEFNYSWCLMGADAIEKTGNPLPDETIAICLIVKERLTRKMTLHRTRSAGRTRE